MTHPPHHRDLPLPRSRAGRGWPEWREIRVPLEVVTPILGGSYKTREVDEVEIIRPASVRGHLRFWWRALYGAHYGSSESLYVREGELWGRAGTRNDGGRSKVDVRVRVVGRPGHIDKNDITDMQDISAYAMWPARAERKQGMLVKLPASRRVPHTLSHPLI